MRCRVHERQGRSAVRVFVSYRRGDASAWAGRLRDGLTARLDENDVYQDVVTVDAGENFALSINSALERCDVVLAVITLAYAGLVFLVNRILGGKSEVGE